ncbi:MAG: phosphoribosyltransferase [Actinomycetia bacterium]|nr:phosphoribosyltransferase [Actinomycetes bacterium]
MRPRRRVGGSDPDAVVFADRRDAGRQLARRLSGFDGDLVVLGLPRGGVPVAFEVARALARPLDVILVRKLGVPSQPELAMGAIGEHDTRVLNDDVIRMAAVSSAQLGEVERREWAELERRSQRFRAARSRVDLKGRTALIVDDGMATGSTAKAACLVARQHGASRIVLAVPVAPADAASRLVDSVDEFIALETPTPFYGVGRFYRDFGQTSDDEVVSLLVESLQSGTDEPDPDPLSADVIIECGSVDLPGHLEVPAGATGLVIFVHGSGSSRHSPRNQEVARRLREHGLGTLLFDLLTDREATDRDNVFNIELLAERLRAATEWVTTQLGSAALPLGYFGASTGAGVALWAAAEPGAGIAAVVSRGGRPDLARSRLGQVTTPTRLIVGGDDEIVVGVNREALTGLGGNRDLRIVPGATHLFEEPGALEQVAGLAAEWFGLHLI